MRHTTKFEKQNINANNDIFMFFSQNQTKWPMQKHARELDICAWFLNFGNALTVRGIQYVQEKEHQNNCNDHVFLISTQKTLKFINTNIIYQQQINKNNFLKQIK